MTEVHMTKFGKGQGNCLQACIASLLDKSIEEIPNFADFCDEWYKYLYEWCLDNDYSIIHIEATTTVGVLILNAYAIGIFSVKNSKEEHAIIMKCEFDEIKDETWSWSSYKYFDPNPNHVKLDKLKAHLFIFPKK